MPSCPDSLRPQHQIAPPPASPQTCSAPTLILENAIAAVPGYCVTFTGVPRSPCDPLPFSPHLPPPQQKASVPLSAHVFQSPTDALWNNTPFDTTRVGIPAFTPVVPGPLPS